MPHFLIFEFPNVNRIERLGSAESLAHGNS